MPHPEREHELQIALATALRERDQWNREAGLLRDALITWQRNGEKTTAERDALRADVQRLRETTKRLIAVLDSPFVNVEATATTAAELTEAMSQARAALSSGGDRGP